MTDAPYLSPFRDDQGIIPGSAILLRRVPPQFVDWNTEDGLPRITAGAFQDYSARKAQEDFGLPGACMSVSILSVLLENGYEPHHLLVGFGAAHGLAQLTATAVRSCDQGIQVDARPGAPWHAVVFAGAKAKKDNAMKACLAASASWHTAPTERLGSA